MLPSPEFCEKKRLMFHYDTLYMGMKEKWNMYLTNEPLHQKTNNLHMRNQRHRSAVQ